MRGGVTFQFSAEREGGIDRAENGVGRKEGRGVRRAVTEVHSTVVRRREVGSLRKESLSKCNC